MLILVAGASGFIGSRLVDRLSSSSKYNIRCITRNVESLAGRFDPNVEILKADVTDYSELVKSMAGVDVAFYLIHSMEGSAKGWARFAERDRVAAENFARASKDCGVKRIIYLGGLTHGRDDELSEHMRSRRQVGEILKTSNAKVTIFNAAVILGEGGKSFDMLRFLVERLPVMVCPKWVLTKSQPIAVDDVIAYLAGSIEAQDTEGRQFDIGGPDAMNYIDVMKRYARTKKKSIRIMIIPFLSLRLSSYWIDLVTPVKASIARPLIDSLKHEATVKDDSIKKIIPLKLKNFEEAVKIAEGKSVKRRRSLFDNALLISLIILAAIGLAHYVLDMRPELLKVHWLVLSSLWFLGIAFSTYFVHCGARLGALFAAILGSITLAIWLADDFHLILGISLIATRPSLVITGLNLLGMIVAATVLFLSFVVFRRTK